MSAETLREAARLMRERAEGATPGPWECDESVGVNDLHFGRIDTPVIEPMGYYGPRLNDAQHMASWHPAVALAVADWLEHAAEACGLNRTPYLDEQHALAHAVATAYLGQPAPTDASP